MGLSVIKGRNTICSDDKFFPSIILLLITISTKATTELAPLLANPIFSSSELNLISSLLSSWCPKAKWYAFVFFRWPRTGTLVGTKVPYRCICTNNHKLRQNHLWWSELFQFLLFLFGCYRLLYDISIAFCTKTLLWTKLFTFRWIENTVIAQCQWPQQGIRFEKKDQSNQILHI